MDRDVRKYVHPGAVCAWEDRPVNEVLHPSPTISTSPTNDAPPFPHRALHFIASDQSYLLKKLVIFWLLTPGFTGLPFVPLLVPLLVFLPDFFSGDLVDSAGASGFPSLMLSPKTRYRHHLFGVLVWTLLSRIAVRASVAERCSRSHFAPP